MNSGTSLIRLDPTQGVTLAHNIDTFLTTFNPISSIARTVMCIAACRVEIERIRRQMYTVDAMERLALEAIEVRRQGMQLFFNYANTLLAQHRHDRHVITNIMTEMSQLIRKTNYDSDGAREARQLAAQILPVLSRDLVASHRVSVEALEQVVIATQQDLIALPPIRAFLSSGR